MHANGIKKDAARARRTKTLHRFAAVVSML